MKGLSKKLDHVLPPAEPPETPVFPCVPMIGCEEAMSLLDHSIPSSSSHLPQTEQECEGEGHGIRSQRLQLKIWAEIRSMSVCRDRKHRVWLLEADTSHDMVVLYHPHKKGLPSSGTRLTLPVLC